MFQQTEWQQRLSSVMETMREMSRQSDPQAMVRSYGERMRTLLPADRRISLSRRGLESPQYRITRYSGWADEVNPWKEPEKLPLLSGGALCELLYGDEPRIISDLNVTTDDPCREYLAGQRSLVAIPLLDQGVALNMVVLTRSEPSAFNSEQLPEFVWMANLFGRATHNLVLAEEVRQAYEQVDRELRTVAEIQRSLLPARLPEIPNLKLAASYQTSRRAGGDYYDFFPLPDGQWGILIADVSGHGTPAAVMMAVTHSIAHMYAGPAVPPGHLLDFVNRHLAARYTGDFGTFVTAFYGVYDPLGRELTYASAGHNAPRLKRCGARTAVGLPAPRNLPLGISPDETYESVTERLCPGDQIIFYTDGITEAQNGAGELFGVERLDRLFGRCGESATTLISTILQAIDEFMASAPPADDRTLVVGTVL